MTILWRRSPSLNSSGSFVSNMTSPWMRRSNWPNHASRWILPQLPIMMNQTSFWTNSCPNYLCTSRSSNSLKNWELVKMRHRTSITDMKPGSWSTMMRNPCPHMAIKMRREGILRLKKSPKCSQLPKFEKNVVNILSQNQRKSEVLFYK